MAVGETLTRLRKERGLTQKNMARKLYVTRQAISRWEMGETEPSVDMCQLIAVTFDMPLLQLLDMPDGDFCQSCGMPFYQETDYGTEADGSRSSDFCSLCFTNGAFFGEAMGMRTVYPRSSLFFLARQSPNSSYAFLGRGRRVAENRPWWLQKA